MTEAEKKIERELLETAAKLPEVKRFQLLGVAHGLELASLLGKQEEEGA